MSAKSKTDHAVTHDPMVSDALATYALVAPSLPVPPNSKDESAAWDALKALVSGAVKEAIAPANGVTAGTITHLVAKFLEHKTPDVKPRTVKTYGWGLGWLTKHFGDRSASDLDLAHVRAQSAKEEWGDTNRANIHWVVNMFLRWCGRTDQLPLPPKESRGADSVIPEAVHKRVLAETKGDFRALCHFLWLTGCRPGEATNLKFEAVDLDSKSIKIKQHKTRRHGKVRTIHLCSEAAELVRDQAEKYKATGLVFRATRGKPFSLQSMTMRFQRISVKVQHRVTSYMHRHTYATRALGAGESDTVVAAILGHSSTAMVHHHYSHISEQGRVLKDATERIAKKAGSATTPPNNSM